MYGGPLLYILYRLRPNPDIVKAWIRCSKAHSTPPGGCNQATCILNKDPTEDHKGSDATDKKILILYWRYKCDVDD